MQLALLLNEAQVATPGTRITWRDRIAAFGPRAIEAMEPWLGQPTLAAFAVRVIEHAGLQSAEADSVAIDALRHARAKAPSVIKGDIDVALRHLRQGAVSPTVAPTVGRATKTAPSRLHVVRQRRGFPPPSAAPTSTRKRSSDPPGAV